MLHDVVQRFDFVAVQRVRLLQDDVHEPGVVGHEHAALGQRGRAVVNRHVPLLECGIFGAKLAVRRNGPVGNGLGQSLEVLDGRLVLTLLRGFEAAGGDVLEPVPELQRVAVAGGFTGNVAVREFVVDFPFAAQVVRVLARHVGRDDRRRRGRGFPVGERRLRGQRPGHDKEPHHRRLRRATPRSAHRVPYGIDQCGQRRKGDREPAPTHPPPWTELREYAARGRNRSGPS